ncbi:hypothetical protein [Leucothrix pacifica]|uniref:Uncharacterized protein n=1 Tax=Leucothrix pacifica TaxID=1247513 RepID=A0A317C701_9GAMM|nr:hypothetical protein [Leucothrix pacifica]PWQ94308.1 hypothetical protein DKW60_16865 [Leucothrix pacifica]
MLEYLFFNQQYCDEFTETLANRNISFQIEHEAVQKSLNVKVPDFTNDELWNDIDSLYDELSEKDTLLLQESFEDDANVSTAGIYIQLANNQQTIAKVDPDVMNRILSSISMEEFNQFIEVIVDSVENPDDSPICKTS